MNRVHGTVRVLAGTLLVLAMAACGGPSQAPGQPAPRQGGGEQGDSAAAPGGGQRGGQGQPQPRPYARVITSGATTSRGFFDTHRIGDRLYFEIPDSAFGAEMLVIRRVAAGTGSQSNLNALWERDGNRVRLRRKDYDVTANPDSAIARNVEAMRIGDIIASFNVEAWSPDSAAVIEVTRLFTSNIPEFAGVNSPQTDRSFIELALAFPENVVVEATQTGTRQPPAGGGGGGGGGGGANQQRGAQTARFHWSFRMLPADPMMPRLWDARVGFNSVRAIDYSRPEHRAQERRFIRRFRLEKQNPSAPVSDPVEPIVFWIDPATPDWLKPWIKSGIEAWQPAYEEAGFSNAIIGRVPAPGDTTWSPYDGRYSIVYWRPSTTQNATGGQQADPRTGEILKAEVNMFHNVMNLLRNWYFVQVSPLDPRAHTLPLPDSLMGRLVEYVVTHEVGHAIGFPHNMKASAMYPADSVRSADFLRRMGGHVSTLMDYSRFNYVVQPEDNVPPDLLIPKVGPYDRFAVMWGHRPIEGARTPDDELRTLDQWARQQDTIPWYRYTTDDAPNDPYDLTEAVGDADAVKSSTLGVKNLRRVAASLLRVAERPGQSYQLLDELYGQVVGQWGRYNGHVAAIIGGAYTQERYGTGPRFEPVEAERQREAIRYLADNAFQVPDFLLDPEVLRRIESYGVLARIRQAQAGVLNSLFNEQRLIRLSEYEALSQGDAYTVGDLLTDLRAAAWGELRGGRVDIDPFRRNMQRAYLEAVDRTLNPPPPPQGGGGGGPFGGGNQPPRFANDSRAALRGHLRELDRAIQDAIGRAANATTRLHLEDLRIEIEKILNPE